MSVISQTRPAAGAATGVTPVAGTSDGTVKPKDTRYLALRNFAISISVFNIFGYTLLGFEMLSAWAQQRTPKFRGNGLRGVYEFLLPAHITALAVNMLLYANNQILPVIFGVVLGVSAKHALQAPINGRMRHFMNPSNFGIAVSLLVFGSWVNIAPPYEFTERANTFFRIMIPLILAISGTVINALLTKKTALIVGWLGGFAIQAFVRHGIWHVSLFGALGPMTGVAFMLFTNYMISDPGTTPTKGLPKFMFGASVAMTYGVLMEFNVVFTLFYALGLVCLARGLGWWGVHLRNRRRQRHAVGAPAEQLPAQAVAA